MFAQQRRQFDTEIVQGNDPVDAFAPRQMRRPLADVRMRHFAPNVEKGVDRIPRPVRIAKLLLSEEEHPATLPATLAQELVPFEVRGNAQHRQHSVTTMRLPSAVLAEQRRHAQFFIVRHRHAEVETLTELRAESAKLEKLIGRFDPFGNDLQAEGVAESNYRLHDLRVVTAKRDAVHE